jgi:excinuclease ABC subunit C
MPYDKTKNFMEYFKHILKNVPRSPGIYKMKDEKGKIIYVGKAKDLKNRLSSYFNKGTDKSTKTVKMLEHVKDLDYTVVDSELEALLLETNLIKELRPKYNILMKDDKNYVYIKITVNEDFPRILITRTVLKDKARYFGPKTAQYKVENTLKVLKKIFPFRHCQLQIDYQKPITEGESANPKIKHRVSVSRAGIKYPCLDYHIKRCVGPCIGTVSPEEYKSMIGQIIRFLEGKQDEIINSLRDEMLAAATSKKFEQAAAIRDKLQNIEDLMETQIITDPHLQNLDVINYIIIEERAYFNLFQIREGKLINQENFILNAPADENQTPELLTAFLEQYYEKATDLPKQVMVPHEIIGLRTIENWLTQSKGQNVTINIPLRGHNEKLLELSLQNAQSYAKQTEVKWQGAQKQDRDKAMEDLGKLLNLAKKPSRLECYDISHFQGTETVSSMVVFENGFPKKEDYRKFKLHQETSGEPDDFASMEETLLRRLKYLKPGVENLSIRICENKKAKKILSGFAKKPLKERVYYSIHKEKTCIGYIQIIQKNKKTLIETMHFTQQIEPPNLIKKIIEKLKLNRIYLMCDEKIVESYEQIGFQQIKKSPVEFKTPKTSKILVFEKNKYRSDKSFEKKPNLIIIDGGKGQLGVAVKVLKKYGLSILLISLAKREEEIFIPGKSMPILLKSDNPILHLIQHIRDEAHRFAITFHQNLRLKAAKASELDTIAGIGPETKLKLLRKFGSVRGIKKTASKDLAKEIGHAKAKQLKSGLSK